MLPLLGPALAPALPPLLANALSAALVGIATLMPPVTSGGSAPPAPPAPPGFAGPASDPARAASPPWAPPLDGDLVVLARLDLPRVDWLPGHRGVDLAAASGDAVRAAGAGVVTWAGPVVDREVVVVLHADGRRTTYEPVAAVIGVGDLVEAGDVIGRLSTGGGHCGGVPSCLHWGLRRGTDYLDPLALLGLGRPVLLPLG